MKVAVDPGHGNSNRRNGVYDPGAEHVSNGVKYQEADIALRYGLALKDILRARQIDVFMTRENATDDAPVGERARNAERAGCDMFISLHLNDNESEAANGLEVLYRNAEYEPLAKAMHDALIRTIKPRGAKQRLDLAVLKFDGPAVLIELGFISNDRDRTELLDAQMRGAICETIADVSQQQSQPAMMAASVLAAAQATGIADSCSLPGYACDLLGPDSGIPWNQAQPLPGMNFYSGIVWRTAFIVSPRPYSMNASSQSTTMALAAMRTATSIIRPIPPFTTPRTTRWTRARCRSSFCRCRTTIPTVRQLGYLSW